MSEEGKPTGPDFSQGVPLANIPEHGVLLGHAAGEPVLVARSGGEVFAIGAECTHYHGPLAQGLRVGDTIRCPWHHACFSLRTGEALRAPALDPVVCWRVEQRDGTVIVHDRLAPAKGAAPAPSLEFAGIGCHRRRRCGGASRGRDVAARRLSRAGDDAERRERAAL